MKPMKFFNSEKDYFSEKAFLNIEHKPWKFKYINFRDIFRILQHVAPIN